MPKLKIHTVNVDPEETQEAIEKLKDENERSFSWFVRWCVKKLLSGKLKVPAK